jgi:predicted lipid-binding transport protein (Tim44 family)
MRLNRLKSARIADASVGADGFARVSVSFEADLTDGEAQRTAKEIWTFKRAVKADTPNWLLDEVATAS